MLSQILIRTKHQVNHGQHSYHSIWNTRFYFETTGLFNLHLIHIDDSNTLTAERVQGEPDEKTGGKHNMKVEHDNIKQNAQGIVGTNENLRDHIDGIKCSNSVTYKKDLQPQIIMPIHI